MLEPAIEDITRTITAALRPRRIIMFGSRARGEAGADSDVDLMVETETAEPPAQRIRTIDALFGLRRWSMDVIVYKLQEIEEQRRYRHSLIRRIEAEGRMLHQDSAGVSATVPPRHNEVGSLRP